MPASEELRRSWEITERHLKTARNLLPEPVRSRELYIFQSFLEANEFGLAFDELVAIADENQCSEEFWRELGLAAINMGVELERKG